MKGWKLYALCGAGVILLTVATVVVMNKIQERKFSKWLGNFMDAEDAPMVNQ